MVENQQELEELKIDRRISYLESEFTNLIQELRKSEDSRTRWEEKVEKKLDLITSRRTDWSVIISFVSILIVIAALVLTPLYKEISRLDSVVSNMPDKINSNVNEEIRNLRESTSKDVKYLEERFVESDKNINEWMQMIDLNGTRAGLREIGRLEGRRAEQEERK